MTLCYWASCKSVLRHYYCDAVLVGQLSEHFKGTTVVLKSAAACTVTFHHIPEDCSLQHCSCAILKYEKVRGVPVHDMKAYGKRGGVDPFTLNIITRLLTRGVHTDVFMHCHAVACLVPNRALIVFTVWYQ